MWYLSSGYLPAAASSAHHQAASVPTYVKNINLLEANRGISATRYCEGCRGIELIMHTKGVANFKFSPKPIIY